MKYTSAELNREINRLIEEKNALLTQENNLYKYNAATTEKPADLIPDYDFELMQTRIDTIDEKIIDYKHKLNIFNTTTEVGTSGLTIDQVLVKIPQMRSKRNKLYSMSIQPNKKRASMTNGVIDYIYTSYNPKDAKKQMEAVDTELNYLQGQLDKINNSLLIEV